MATYLVRSPTLIGDEIKPKGVKVEYAGAPTAGMAPLSEDAHEPASRARIKRKLQRWLGLGEALLQRF